MKINALMWLISQMAPGLLVWPVLVTSSVSLPTNFRSAEVTAVVGKPHPEVHSENALFMQSAAKVQAQPKEKLFRHGLPKTFQPQIPAGLQPSPAPAARHEKAAGKAKTIGFRATVSVPHDGGAEKPVELLRSSLASGDVSFSKIIALTLFAVVLMGLLLTFCFADDSGGFGSEEASARKPSGSEERVEVAQPPPSFTIPQSSERSANTKTNLLSLEPSPGTWAKTFRNADQSSKEALELLFRCNIIPMQEFANSYVSQEHIDECVWISTQMLRQKSLEEWVEAWPEAMKTFEESVTACFAARTDVISTLYGNSCPNSPGSPRSDRGIMDCRSAASPGPNMRPPLSNVSSVSVLPPGDQTPPVYFPLTKDRRSNTYSRTIPVKTNVSREASAVSTLTTEDQALESAQMQFGVQERKQPQEEYEELLQGSPGRSSVLFRCREIMRDTPAISPPPTNPDLGAKSGLLHPTWKPDGTPEFSPLVPRGPDYLAGSPSFSPDGSRQFSETPAQSPNPLPRSANTLSAPPNTAQLGGLNLGAKAPSPVSRISAEDPFKTNVALDPSTQPYSAAVKAAMEAAERDAINAMNAMNAGSVEAGSGGNAAVPNTPGFGKSWTGPRDAPASWTGKGGKLSKGTTSGTSQGPYLASSSEDPFATSPRLGLKGPFVTSLEGLGSGSLPGSGQRSPESFGVPVRVPVRLQASGVSQTIPETSGVPNNASPDSMSNDMLEDPDGASEGSPPSSVRVEYDGGAGRDEAAFPSLGVAPK